MRLRDRFSSGARRLRPTVALLEFGAGFVQDSNLPKGSERFVKSLRDALYGHIQRLPYRWHVQNPTGDIIQRCTSDVEVVRNSSSQSRWSQLLRARRS